MKFKKVLFLFLIIFFITGCSTLQFGTKDRIMIDDERSKDVREFALSYSYKVMGIPVKGDKSVAEAVFIHPEYETLFIFVSSPKIGILKTEDGGITFRSQFFKMSYLEKIYGYTNEPESEKDDKIKNEEERPFRLFYHFAVSPVNPDRIVIAAGSYIFLSKNNGLKWDAKNVFLDIENVKIRDVFINENDEIIVLTENKIAVSRDWGKRWEKRLIKPEEMSAFKVEYLTGFYDNSNNILFASLKNKDEKDADLSQKSYYYFYKDKRLPAKSGLYYTGDFGLTWKKTDIHVPVVAWKNNGSYYCAPLYPLSYYDKEFSEKFVRSSLYRNALLDNGTPQNYLEEFAKALFDAGTEDYEIISQKSNRLAVFKNIDDAPIIIEENNFDNLYNGIKKLESLEVIQWKDYWYEDKKSENFFYEYNPWYIFKRWTGMRTNNPVLYNKTKDNIYYRVRPGEKFLKTFIKYSLEKEMELNSKNPFMKKTTDLEFFDPALDPTNGFPAVIEYSKDGGKNWVKVTDSEHIRNIIDPLSNKRSGFYWYKNVDQKKILKLQISFGFDKGVNYLTYPMDINIFDNEILMRLNYFSIAKSYKDLYLIPSGIPLKK